MNFCSYCGHPVERRVPAGDHLQRYVCPHCGNIHYQNPKVVAGCIPVWQDKLLLCRRAIEPRKGYWTFPAGYLELGETSSQGAAREALEETGAEIEIGELFVVLNVPDISQIYMVHRARALSDKHHPTPESSETALMGEADIPWRELAFPTIHHSLKFFFADRSAGRKDFHTLDIHPDDWNKLRHT